MVSLKKNKILNEITISVSLKVLFDSYNLGMGWGRVNVKHKNF
jgi:hypothetical protein